MRHYNKRVAGEWTIALSGSPGGRVAYRFGDFTLDPDTRQLLLDGIDVHVSPKAFDLLLMLVANRTRAVSKAELQERLWPATFVEETNVATLVAEVRRVLRDSAANPRFVRTVYGFGYRFVGEATQDSGASRHEPSRAKFWLVGDRRQIPLMDGPNVVGRAEDAAIRIDAPGVSRHHVRIVVANGEATLQDLGSKNGTQLNGVRITASCPLADGDEIRLGTIALRFKVSSPMTPTATLPFGGE